MGTDPIEYFTEYDFAESLVVQICHRSELNQLEIILRYEGFVRTIARPLDALTFQDPMDFRRLVFDDVTQLQRTAHRYKTGFRGFDPTNFNLSGASSAQFSTVEIESADVRKIIDARRTKARYKAVINMGSFGTYSFEFVSLLAYQRLARTVLLPGDEYSYFDYYTGESIDFYNPFSND